MPISSGRADTAPSLAFHDVLSDDGTRLRAWTNDSHGLVRGPTVVLCNGLGNNPWAWPALLRPDCGVRVVSWNHRGTGGSARPVDPSRAGLAEFAEDAVSVMDHFGVDRAVLMGWSMGVNTMYEVAARHPERVSGLFAVAGVPGDTFRAMLAPLRLPPPVARALATGLCRVLTVVGRALTPLTRRVPVGARAIWLLTHSGLMFRVEDPGLAAVTVGEFLQTPVDWYAHLALATAVLPPVSLGSVAVPAMFVAGTWDVLAGAGHLRAAAAGVPDGRYVELNGSHFLCLEQPDTLHRLLLDFFVRVGR